MAFQMCPYLAGLDLPVLTNSLHIVDAPLPRPGTRMLVPSGTVFSEQNINLVPTGEDSLPRFHAARLVMGAAAVGARGVMQQDVALVAAERRLLARADEVIVSDRVWIGRSGHIDRRCRHCRRQDGARCRGASGDRGLEPHQGLDRCNRCRVQRDRFGFARTFGIAPQFGCIARSAQVNHAAACKMRAYPVGLVDR